MGPTVLGHELLHKLGGMISGCETGRIGFDMDKFAAYAIINPEGPVSATMAYLLPHLVMGPFGAYFLEKNWKKGKGSEIGLGATMLGMSIPIYFWIQEADTYGASRYLTDGDPVLSSALMTCGLIAYSFGMVKEGKYINQKIKNPAKAKL